VIRTKFAGIGAYLPGEAITNAALQHKVQGFDPALARTHSLDEWARKTHGGQQRHHAGAGEATSDLAYAAARMALTDAGREAADLDLIVLATFTSDHRLPQSAAVVQAKLGASKAKFIEVNSACTGFLDALLVADAMVRVGAAKIALVISAETMSRVIDLEDFIASTVFGDGAGAVVLERSEDDRGVLASFAASDGERRHFVSAAVGGSREPLTNEALAAKKHLLTFDFSAIGAWAGERMAMAVERACALADVSISDIRWFVPHQASARIVSTFAANLKIDQERCVQTYARMGNTSGSSIPLALHAAQHQFRRGDMLCLVAVGAGMAYGATVYRW
jgi:3-oxoacyl-[acyl-carrier-protein] synthase-3